MIECNKNYTLLVLKYILKNLERIILVLRMYKVEKIIMKNK